MVMVNRTGIRILVAGGVCALAPAGASAAGAAKPVTLALDGDWRVTVTIPAEPAPTEVRLNVAPPAVMSLSEDIRSIRS